MKTLEEIREHWSLDACEISGEYWYGTHRLLYHWTLMKGLCDIEDQYENRWCYATREMANEALVEWASRNFEDEPTGWHRHPGTGRRRPDGDPEREYISW